jgi:hypothetical protein
VPAKSKAQPEAEPEKKRTWCLYHDQRSLTMNGPDTMRYILGQPNRIFEALGDLHDARIESLRLSPGALVIAVDDLYSAYLDLPEYRGPLPASIEFGGLSALSIDAPAVRHLTVFAVEVRSAEKRTHSDCLRSDRS